jgi:dihydrofolate synthase/folylpolyglutamate synthase
MVRTPRRRPRPLPLDPAYGLALARLFQRRRFGMHPGLEVMAGLLGELGEPQRSFPAVHVAGSKGKGSVSAFVARVLSGAGGPTGLYTSPHLVSYRERIQVDGVPIAPEAVVSELAEVEAAGHRIAARGGSWREPTFFEATTALGFLHFQRAQVRDAAIEVGLGGEFDATNVLEAPVGVLTTIEYEHTEILGPTLTDVARAKAGILHRGMRAVVGESKPEPLREIERRADRVGVPLWRLGREIQVTDRTIDEKAQRITVLTPHREHARLALPLLGTFQARNAALAVAALDLFSEGTGRSLPERAVREGLAKVAWRGRLERLAGRPTLYVDVAHTPESARALAESLGEIAPFLEPNENAVLFGCLRGKRVEEMLDTLSTLARTVVVVPIRSERTAEVGELKRAAFGRFPRIIVAPSSETGLALARAATAPGGFTLVTGSDYLVGEVIAAVEGTGLIEPDLSDPLLRTPGREGAPPPGTEGA